MGDLRDLERGREELSLNFVSWNQLDQTVFDEGEAQHGMDIGKLHVDVCCDEVTKWTSGARRCKRLVRHRYSRRSNARKCGSPSHDRSAVMPSSSRQVFGRPARLAAIC